MDSLKLILKLFLPPFLSVSILYFTESNLYAYPLVFSLTLSLSNYQSFRSDLPKGILLSLVYCYAAFLIGILVSSGFYRLFELLGIPNDIKIGNWFYTDLSLCLGAFITAPVLTMFLLKSLFKETTSRFTNWIISVTIFVFVSISFIHSEQDVKNYFNIINLWQLVIMFGLQLIINQNAILEKLGAKKSQLTTPPIMHSYSSGSWRLFPTFNFK